MDYFPHDTDASSDEKIEALRVMHGNDGYAFYFILLERIYRSPDFCIVFANETMEETKRILAGKIGITTMMFDEIMITALKWGCFDRTMYENDGVLTSNGVRRRSTAVQERRASQRDRHEQKSFRGENQAETPQSKVKESKEKKRETGRGNGGGITTTPSPNKTAHAEFVRLTNDEYSSLVAKLGSDQRAKRAVEVLDNYKGATGRQYKSDYRAILSWVVNRLAEDEKTTGGRMTNAPKSDIDPALIASFEANAIYVNTSQPPDNLPEVRASQAGIDPAGIRHHASGGPDMPVPGSRDKAARRGAPP